MIRFMFRACPAERLRFQIRFAALEAGSSLIMSNGPEFFNISFRSFLRFYKNSWEVALTRGRAMIIFIRSEGWTVSLAFPDSQKKITFKIPDLERRCEEVMDYIRRAFFR